MIARKMVLETVISALNVKRRGEREREREKPSPNFGVGYGFSTN